MGITGGIACVLLIAVIVAVIVLWVTRTGFGPKKSPPPPSDVLEPPENPHDRR